jgi:hypothetical protein
MRKRIFVLFCFLNACAALLSQKTLTGRVSMYQGRPTIFINDAPQVPLLYSLTDVPGGRQSGDELAQHNLRQFCEDGVRMFQVDVFLEQLWPRERVFDVAYAEKQVAGVLQACPGAAVFIRLHVDPPKWWISAHPEENVRYADSTSSPDWQEGLQRFVEADPRAAVRTSLASVAWKQAATEKIRQFCRVFSKSKAGRHVVGLQVAGGVYGEWHYWGFLKQEADFSAPMTAHFRGWLRRRYGSDAALQTAWLDPGALLSEVAVPTPAERAQRAEGYFRLPGKDQKVMDYYQCQHELVADLIVDFAREVKANWRRPVIVGAFYGYFFSCFSRQAAGGHLAVQRVLRSPHIDYLAGPQSYLPQAEKPGEPYRSRSLVLSLRLHGKLWLDEMDQQPRRSFPYLGGTKDNREKHEATVLENVAQLRRNLMFSHAKGMGLWLYDFGLAGLNLGKDNEASPQHGVTGYWDHPALHAEIRKFMDLARKTLHEPYQSGADLLLVYDTEVDYQTPSLANDKDSLSLQVTDYLSLQLFYSGAVFDPIHLDDLDKVDLATYKAVIFANTFRLDSAERRLIREKVCTGQRDVFWLSAPGYLDEVGTSQGAVSALLGMDMGRVKEDASSQVRMDSSRVGVLPMERAWGRRLPLFYVSDPRATAWGHYTQTGLAAVAMVPDATHNTWFVGVPLLQPAAWRAMLLHAGVHCFGAEKDIFYAGSGWLTLHSKRGGLRKIALSSGKSLELDLLDRPTTLWIDLRTLDVH